MNAHADTAWPDALVIIALIAMLTIIGVVTIIRVTGLDKTDGDE